VPYLLIVQHDFLDSLPTRVVVPLARGVKNSTRLNPVLEIEGEKLTLLTQDMASVRIEDLGRHVTSLAHRRTEILAAIDFLLTGF
jgi:toxin CcdB